MLDTHTDSLDQEDVKATLALHPFPELHPMQM